MAPKLMENRAGLGRECAKLLERIFSKLIKANSNHQSGYETATLISQWAWGYLKHIKLASVRL